MNPLAGLMILGAAIANPLGIALFAVGTLVSCVVWLAVSQRRTPRVIYWILTIALNVPSVIFIVLAAFGDENAQNANFNFGLALLVFFALGPFGAGWLAGYGLGWLMKSDLGTTKALLT